jgi:hypothetical protein
MREGLLWYDANGRRSPVQKVDQAAARYAERVGRPATLCRVNPAQLFVHPGIRVEPDPFVLPNHFLIGQDEELAPVRRRKRSA